MPVIKLPVKFSSKAIPEVECSLIFINDGESLHLWTSSLVYDGTVLFFPL